MNMTPHLAWIALTLTACSSKPSYEEENRAYNAALRRAIAKAAPTYQVFTTMRNNLALDTAACTAPPDPALIRVSSNRLKVLTGDPVGRNGWLLADTDPAPDDPDPRRQTDSHLGFGSWDADAIASLPSPVQAVDGVGSAAAAERRVGKNVAAIAAAPGFLVQAIDEYVPGAVVGGEGFGGGVGFTPGTIHGRVIVFDQAGRPTCHYPYAAENTSIVQSTRNNGGFDGAIHRDLAAQMTRAIIAAFAGEKPAT